MTDETRTYLLRCMLTETPIKHPEEDTLDFVTGLTEDGFCTELRHDVVHKTAFRWRPGTSDQSYDNLEICGEQFTCSKQPPTN